MAASGNATLLLAVCGGTPAASLGKILHSTSKQEAAALEKGLVGGRAAIAGSAFLCARGRHEHILTAGFRRGKGHEKFES